MRYGGFSQYGGATQYGGRETSRWEIFYNLLLSLKPPRVYSEDPEAIVNKHILAEANLLGNSASVLLERVFAEMFPHTAVEDLPEWEELLNIVPPEGEAISDRQLTAVGRYRGGVASSLPDLRKILEPILSPEYYFRDPFTFGLPDSANDGLMSEWETFGGSITVSGSDLLHVDALPFSDFLLASGTAPMVRFDIPDRSDDFVFDAYLDPLTAFGGGPGSDQSMGFGLWQDDDNAILFELIDKSGTESLRVSRLRNGVKIEDSESATISAPTLGMWMRLQRIGDSITASYRASAAIGDYDLARTELVTFAREITPRKVGFFSESISDGNSSTPRWGEFRMQFATPHNNVAIFEKRLANILPTFNASQKFFAYVYRNPLDSGSYDITNAQRAMDSAKPAHTLIYVGESAVFRTDDSASLTDRDVLGG